jgi:biotin carboxyl carrier protein
MSVDPNNLDQLIVNGAQYKTTLTNKYKNRKIWKMPNLNFIYSFIPGTVIEVKVKPGQRVKQGETLMILDAMKMYNNVLMPFDGEVVKVNVESKDKVTKHQAMIEIRPK